MSLVRFDQIEANQLGCPEYVDALGCLALSLDLNWVKGRLFMLVTAFVDETGMDGPRVMLAGYVARLHHWQGFRNQWEKLLKEERIPYSHVTEMRKGKQPFEGWDNRKKINNFARRASNVIDSYCDFGLTVAVDRSTQKQYSKTMPLKTSPDSAYGMCARQFFEQVPNFVERIMGLSHARINFVFERHDQHFGDAERIFHDIKCTTPQLRDRLGTITPGEKLEFAGLQAADLLAYGARRHEPTSEFSRVPPSGEPIFGNSKPNVCPLFRVNIDDQAIDKYQESAAEIGRRKRWYKRSASRDAEG